MIQLIMGKSGAGKDTLLKNIINTNKYKLESEQVTPIVSYTTRPMREGEIDGVDYNFISKDEFLKLIKSKKLTEYRTYNTMYNNKLDTWYYGTPLITDPDKNYVIVVDIEGAMTFIKKYKNKCTGIYIHVDDDIRRERAVERGSFDETEWNRRLKDDSVKFSEKNLMKVKRALKDKFSILNNNGVRTNVNKMILSDIKKDDIVFFKETWTNNLVSGIVTEIDQDNETVKVEKRNMCDSNGNIICAISGNAKIHSDNIVKLLSQPKNNKE